MNSLTLSVLVLILACTTSCGYIDLNTEEEKSVSETGWYEPADTIPREQCPCCDYISLAERGAYLICPICFWEDDGQDIDELDLSSGPNQITLRQGRANFKKFGACEEEVVEHVISVEERKKYRREIRNVDEKSINMSLKEDGCLIERTLKFQLKYAWL